MLEHHSKTCFGLIVGLGSCTPKCVALDAEIAVVFMLSSFCFIQVTG